MPSSKQSKKPPAHQPPSEQSSQGTSKGKLPMRPPREQPLQAESISKRPQQPVKEQSMQGNSKGKQPIRPLPEQPVQADSTSKRPQQLPPDQSMQGTSKGKQPMRPPPEQPVQGGFTSRRPQQLPPDQSMQANLDVAQPQSEQPMQPNTKSKHSQKAQTKQPVQDNNEGKQPTRKPVLGNPRFMMTRIPVRTKARLKWVELSVGPDTASRHPQTFFFKNLPRTDPYWGFLNDKASTATRVVRLENEGKPTPYFLLACRGEHPKPTSPRNNNAIFAEIHEPIFGDAFIFKLDDPEIFGNGYANFVHIEEDICKIKWIPEAIRIAAGKVDYAMARDANPGFPDPTNYADPETMLKDAQKMFKWLAAIRKAAKKYGDALPLDANSGLPDPDTMTNIFDKLADQVTAWGKDGLLPTKVSTGLSDYKTVEGFVLKMTGTVTAMVEAAPRIDAAMISALSNSTNVGSSGDETKNAVESVTLAFQVAREAFFEVEAIAMERLARRTIIDLVVNTIPEVLDPTAHKGAIGAMMTKFAAWKKDRVIPAGGFIDLKMADMVNKMEAARQAMEGDSNIPQVIGVVNEALAAYQATKVRTLDWEAFTKLPFAQQADAA